MVFKSKSRETALHIAVKNKRYEALQILVGWLKTNEKSGAKELEKKILNQEDEEGNTILHISVLSTDLRVIVYIYFFFCFHKKFNFGFILLPIAINCYILFEEHMNENLYNISTILLKISVANIINVL
jgi:hypothetical protein